MILLPNTSLTQLIKKIAMDAVNASKPCNVITGKVKSISPIQIQIGQKIVLDEDFLIISDTVSGKLLTNKSVIMIRQSGGQRYVVFDTVA